jgi:RNA polymerase sigma-70 factor (ECF subfamily)
VSRRSAEPTATDHLLMRAAGGDENAFAALYDELAPRVLRRIRSVLRDAAQAEEVLQEVFLEIWQQASRYDPQKSGSVGWVLTRAHARSVDRVRSSQSDHERDRRIGLRDRPIPYDTVAETVELRIESRRVVPALRGLTELQREAVVLAYGRGYTHSELAEHLEVPIGTVKSRIHGGLEQLRRALGEAS